MTILHSFDFNITSYCQASCSGCARNEPDGEQVAWLTPKHMSVAKFAKILDSGKGILHYDEIQLCGELGDPMMHPKITDIIKTSLQYNPELIKINTNGGLRSVKWYQEMSKYKQLRIMWGIDGIDQETNNKYRVGVNFNKAFANMKAWFQSGGKGEWHFILFNWNYKQIPQVVELSKSIGCNVLFKINRTDDIREGMQEGPELREAEELLEKHWHV